MFYPTHTGDTQTGWYILTSCCILTSSWEATWRTLSKPQFLHLHSCWGEQAELPAQGREGFDRNQEKLNALIGAQPGKAQGKSKKAVSWGAWCRGCFGKLNIKQKAGHCAGRSWHDPLLFTGNRVRVCEQGDMAHFRHLHLNWRKPGWSLPHAASPVTPKSVT